MDQPPVGHVSHPNAATIKLAPVRLIAGSNRFEQQWRTENQKSNLIDKQNTKKKKNREKETLRSLLRR